jgi:hypothetical protein
MAGKSSIIKTVHNCYNNINAPFRLKHTYFKYHIYKILVNSKCNLQKNQSCLVLHTVLRICEYNLEDNIMRHVDKWSYVGNNNLQPYI